MYIRVSTSEGPGISIFANNEAIPRKEKGAEKEAERKRGPRSAQLLSNQERESRRDKISF